MAKASASSSSSSSKTCCCWSSATQLSEVALTELFHEFDTNSSNDIDRYELDGLLAFFGILRKDVVTATIIFKSLDVNHDGSIQLEEWLDFVTVR
mgnify:FL=1|tara:strand:+ start:336 stop:620 length:285 start_codon:yes stop_codon:yes gene_type:complete